MTKRKWVLVAIYIIVALVGGVISYVYYKFTDSDIAFLIVLGCGILAVGTIIQIFYNLLDDFKDWLNRK